MNRCHPTLPLVALVCAAALGACSDAAEPPAHLRVPGGEPEKGRSLIQAYGCGTCHRVDGVRGARGTVGPSLADYAERTFLAGSLPNTPRHLVPWLMNPVAFDVRSGMPDMGLSEPEARHIAAYLYTLGAGHAPVYPGGPPLTTERAELPALVADNPPIGEADSPRPTPRGRFIEWKAGRWD